MVGTEPVVAIETNDLGKIEKSDHVTPTSEEYCHFHHQSTIISSSTQSQSISFTSSNFHQSNVLLLNFSFTPGVSVVVKETFDQLKNVRSVSHE
jgi:hypothetical protein